MNDTFNTSSGFPRLPLPDIREEATQYTHKQGNRREEPSKRFCPPKYKSRLDSNFNRSHNFSANVSLNNSHIAHAISFRNENTNELAEAVSLPMSTSIYNTTANESYFEQCFTRLSKIGEGSFGEVFKVRFKDDGKLYAVKMSKQLFRSEHYRAERLEEVRRYEEFSGHENCVRFYRAWEQDDRLYMQMELCRESLETYLWRCKQIPEERIWSIMLDLLLALKSLHDRNLLHLDIKLDNVLIDDDDTCKLTDFGLVIDVDKANQHKAIEGDSRYIAPEIMQGQFSKAADIFSLGIAMLELSCYLELPANGSLWLQLRSGVLPDEFLNTISYELQAVIKSMMTPDATCRPTVDRLLAHKKFTTMLRRRNQWQPLRSLRRTIRRSRSLVFSKLTNIRSATFRLVTYVLQLLHIRKAIANTPTENFVATTTIAAKTQTPRVRLNIIGSTPMNSKLNGKMGVDGTPGFLSDDTGFDISQQGTPGWSMVNSTPLYTLQNSNFGSPHQLGEPSPALESSSNSFIRRPQDTSTLRRKLFTQDIDT